MGGLTCVIHRSEEVHTVRVIEQDVAVGVKGQREDFIDELSETQSAALASDSMELYVGGGG